MSNYYEPPTQEIFEEIKREAIKIWETYDNTDGYVDEKVGRIKDLPNVSDNAMYIVAMFDWINRDKLLTALSEPAKEFIISRITV